jgi:hypothetical protein
MAGYRRDLTVKLEVGSTARLQQEAEGLYREALSKTDSATELVRSVISDTRADAHAAVTRALDENPQYKVQWSRIQSLYDDSTQRFQALAAYISSLSATGQTSYSTPPSAHSPDPALWPPSSATRIILGYIALRTILGILDGTLHELGKRVLQAYDYVSLHLWARLRNATSRTQAYYRRRRSHRRSHRDRFAQNPNRKRQILEPQCPAEEVCYLQMACSGHCLTSRHGRAWDSVAKAAPQSSAPPAIDTLIVIGAPPIPEPQAELLTTSGVGGD